MADPFVSRRNLFRGIGGAAVLISGGSLLAACGGDKKEAGKEAVKKFQAVKLPTYVQYKGSTPDLPGTPGGIRPGYFSYPKDKPKAVPEIPGKGGQFKGMATIYYPLPPGPDKNKYWQGLNDRLGAKLDMIMVPNADYNTKLATVIAGGDLPDFVMIPRGADSPPELPKLLAAKFQDLTEFLSGDAIKKYPNLANLPTRAWKNTVFDGKIFGLPVPRDAVGAFPFIRADIFKQLDLSTKPANYEEFYEAAKTISDPKKKRWTFALAGHAANTFRSMTNAPNTWKWDGKKLTHLLESEEDRKVLETQAKFWKEGLIHPDAFSDTIQFKQLFNAGSSCVNYDGYQGWQQYIADNVDNEGYELGLLTVPGWDGGVGKIALGGATFLGGLTALKKGDKARVEEQLAIANWLAAPFGSEEYFYRLFGTEGVHHTLDKDGNPVLTEVGRSETVIPIRYMAENPSVIYQPGRPQDVKTQHEYESATVPVGIPNPCLGMYSDTEASKGPTLDTKIGDVRNEVIQGRKTMKDWDQAVKDYFSGGYENVRAEYTEQIQQQGPNKE